MAGLKDPFDTETRRKLLESASGGFNVTPPAMPAYTPPQPGGLSIPDQPDADYSAKLRAIPFAQPQAPQAPAEPQGSSWFRNYALDPLVALGGGAASLVTDVGGLALTEPAYQLGKGINALTGWDTMERGAAQMKDYVAQASQGTRDAAHGLLSPEAKKLMESQFVRETRQGEGGDFSFLGTDYRFNPNDMGFAQSLGKMGLHFLESAPASLGGMAIGAKAAQLASRAIPAASKLSPALGAALPTGIQAGAFGLSEGIMAGEQNANQMRAQILNMSEGEKQQNANYSLWVDKLRGQGMGLEQAREEATRRVADETYNAIRQMTVPTTAALSAPFGTLTGSVASRLFGMGTAQQAEQAAAQGLGRSALQYLKFGGAEAAQEAPQSAFETGAQNLATAGFYPERGLTEGILDAAITGGLVGGLSGAAFHGAGNLANRMRGQQPPEQATPPDSPAAGNYPRVDALGQFDTETEGPLPGVPGLRGFPQYGGGLDQAQPQAAPMPQDLIRADQLQSGQEVDLLGQGGLRQFPQYGGMENAGGSDAMPLDAANEIERKIQAQQRRDQVREMLQSRGADIAALAAEAARQGAKTQADYDAFFENAVKSQSGQEVDLLGNPGGPLAPRGAGGLAGQSGGAVTESRGGGLSAPNRGGLSIPGMAGDNIIDAEFTDAGLPAPEQRRGLPSPVFEGEIYTPPAPGQLQGPQGRKALPPPEVRQEAAEAIKAIPAALFHAAAQRIAPDTTPQKAAQLQRMLTREFKVGNENAAQVAQQIIGQAQQDMPEFQRVAEAMRQYAGQPQAQPAQLPAPAKAAQETAVPKPTPQTQAAAQSVAALPPELFHRIMQQRQQDIEPARSAQMQQALAQQIATGDTKAAQAAAQVLRPLANLPDYRGVIDRIQQAAQKPKQREFARYESWIRKNPDGVWSRVHKPLTDEQYKAVRERADARTREKVRELHAKWRIDTASKLTDDAKRLLDKIKKSPAPIPVLEAAHEHGGENIRLLMELNLVRTNPSGRRFLSITQPGEFIHSEIYGTDTVAAQEEAEPDTTPTVQDSLTVPPAVIRETRTTQPGNYRRVNGRLVESPDAGIVTIKEAGGEKLTVQKLTDEERQAFAQEGQKGNYAVVHANSGEILGIGLGKGGAAKEAAKNIRQMVKEQGAAFPEIASGFAPITDTSTAAKAPEAAQKPRKAIEGAAKTAEDVAAQLAERKKANLTKNKSAKKAETEAVTDYNYNEQATEISNEPARVDAVSDKPLEEALPKERSRDAGQGRDTGEGSRRDSQDGTGRDAGISGARDERGGSVAGVPRNPVRRPGKGVVKPEHEQEHQPDATNYRITEEDRLGEGGRVQKIKDNLEAIRIIKAIEKEGRAATDAEKAKLVRYVGWGGLKNVFDPATNDKAAKKAGDELKELLTESEWKAAMASTLNAHYTASPVINAMYKIVDHFGFSGGRVLEPTVGTGNFIGLMPENLAAQSKWYASELDAITSKIAAQLYPRANILTSTGFQEAEFPYGKFDLAIGNPPFGDERLTDRNKSRAEISGFKIHNYVIAKSGMHLKPNGIMAMVVTSRFLDAKNDEARDYLSKKFDFLGAIRLPNTSFKASAGTEVTTDIVFFRRRMPQDAPGNTAWLETGATMQNARGETVTLNKYFADKPEMMLGIPSMQGSMYAGNREEFTLETDPAIDIEKAIDAIIESGEFAQFKNVAQENRNQAEDVAAVEIEMNRRDVSIGGYVLDNGQVFMREDDDADGNVVFERITPLTKWTEKTTLGQTRFERIKGMLELREKTYALIRAERADIPAAEIERQRAELNRDYDQFVKAYGFINDPANSALMDGDIKVEFGLEANYRKPITAAKAKRAGLSEAKAKADKAAILSQRVFYPYRDIKVADNARDGYPISLSERGKLDLEYIAELTDSTVDKVVKELSTGEKPMIFRDPDTKEWVEGEKYLSGNVKEKYKKVYGLSGYEANAKALKEAFPKDLTPEEIFVELGATWLPPSIYESFLAELGLHGAKVYVSGETGRVSVVGGGTLTANELNVALRNKDYGIPGLFELLANKQPVVAYDVVVEDKKERRVANPQRTQELASVAKGMKQMWKDWLYSDPQRRDAIAKLYNDNMNTNAPRAYDGKLFRMVGANPAIQMRDTQKNAAWRMVQSRTTLLDHVVGAGKTFTVIAGVMERKRLGLSRKSMIVVPNHLVGQWAKDFLTLYPGANIISPSEKDFEKKNRRRLFARIATGKYDAVIVGHSSLKKIPLSPEKEKAFIEAELEHLYRALSEAEENQDKRTVRTISNRIEKRRERIKALQDIERDDTVQFEDLGVDYVVVDESHEFKNLEYATAMQSITGMGDPKGSQKAFDLYMKLRTVLENKSGGAAFATGTPISNSLVEMYSILRYLNSEGLESRGLKAFDAWAKAYAEVDTRDEITSTQKIKTRTVMASFNNLPELLQLYNDFADTVTMSELKRMYALQVRERNKSAGGNEREEFPVPKTKKGGRQLDVAAPSEAQREFMDSLVARAEKIEEEMKSGKFDPSKDNLLWVMSDARKMALDIRIVDPTAPDHPDSKVNRAARNIKETYDKWSADKGTQLVYSDLSTPAKNSKKDADELIENALTVAGIAKDAGVKAAIKELSYRDKWTYLMDKMDRMIEAETIGKDKIEAIQEWREKLPPDELASLVTADTGFSVYDDLKAKLIAAGIPANEIKFIHDAKTRDDKTALFEQVNDGSVRVLIGSSSKMGPGMNAQKRLVALHHLDAPWRPSDVEQREGRIIRQGNDLYMRDPDNFEVDIRAYSTSGTFDSVMWQILARKAEMLEQFRRGARSMVEESGDSASYSEFMAESTGNPAYKERHKLTNEVAELEATMRRAMMLTKSSRRIVDEADTTLSNIRNAIDAAKSDHAAVRKGKFVAEFKGRKYEFDVDSALREEDARYEKAKAAYDEKLLEYTAAVESGDETAKKPTAPSQRTLQHKDVIRNSEWLQMIQALGAEARESGDATAMVNGIPLYIEARKLKREGGGYSYLVQVGESKTHLTRIESYSEETLPLPMVEKLTRTQEMIATLGWEAQSLEHQLRQAQNQIEAAKKTLKKTAWTDKDTEKLEAKKARLKEVSDEINGLEAKLSEERANSGNKYIKDRGVAKTVGEAEADRLTADRIARSFFTANGDKATYVPNAKDVTDELGPRTMGERFFIFLDGKEWNISHVESGLRVTAMGTRESAIDKARQLLEDNDISEIVKKVAKITDEQKIAAINRSVRKSVRSESLVRGGLSKAQAEKLIKPVTSQWGDAGTRVRVVQTQEELAAALPHVTGLQSANGAVEGLYDPKSRAIYLVADNLNEARILPVLAHEAVGHYAAENFIHAPEYERALETVERLVKEGDRRVLRWLNRVDTTQPDLQYRKDQSVRWMEVLAQAVESGEYKSQPAIVKAINTIVNLVKKALAAIGFNSAWINTQSRADLLNMLRTAEARMRQSRGQVVPDANYINSQAPEAARVLAEDMPSRDALETAYLNNPLNTKIAGLNAYHELLERYHRGEKGVFQRAQVSIDVDDLGGMNSVGMKFADELLIQFGDVLKRIAERESGGKVQVIHLHGDEFYVQGPDTATVNAAMNAARAEMSRMKFETVAEYKDGKDTVRIPWIAHGLNFGWGVQEIGNGVSPAQALRMADNKLNMDKANRRAKEYKKPKGLKTDFINPADLRAVPFLDGNAIIRGNASSIEAALKSGLLPWAVNPFNPKNYRAPDKGKAPALWQSNDKMGVVIPAEHIAAVNQALQRAAARFPGQFKYDVDPGNARLNELADTLAKLGKAAEAKRLRAQFGKLTPQQGPAKVEAMVELQQAIIAAYESGAKEPEVGVPHEAPHEAMPLSGEMSEAELQRAYLNSPTERETLGKNFFLDENEKGRKGKANKLQRNFAALGVRDMAYANDNTSHATGDAMIQAFARKFREVGAAHGIELIHIGGGDFYAQHQDGDKAALEKFLRDTLPPAMATVEIEDFDEQGTPWKVQGIQFDYQAGSAKPGETQAAALKRANDELSARKKAEEADKTRIAKGQKPDYINPQKLTVPNLPDAKGNYVIKGNPEAIRATLGSLLEGYPAEVAANKGGLALSISKDEASRLRDQVAQMQGTKNKFAYDIDPDGKLAENYLRKLEELGQRDLAKKLLLDYRGILNDFDAKERMLGVIRETYNDSARKTGSPSERNGRTGTPGENPDSKINPGLAAGSAAELRAGSQGYEAGEKGRLSFAGSNAETADLTELRVAVEMLEAGEDADLVRRETGWFKGADGKWRFEIDDSKAKFTPPEKNADTWPVTWSAKLGDVLKHDRLFAAYPQLRDIMVEGQTMMGELNGKFAGNKITLNTDRREIEQQSTLLHEIQHGIQAVEGFAGGGTPSSPDINFNTKSILARAAFYREMKAQEHKVAWDNPYDLANAVVNEYSELGMDDILPDEVDRDFVVKNYFNAEEIRRLERMFKTVLSRNETPYDRYRRLAGEVEARNVQARMGMSEAQRLKVAPSATADIKDPHVIIRWNGDAPRFSIRDGSNERDMEEQRGLVGRVLDPARQFAGDKLADLRPWVLGSFTLRQLADMYGKLFKLADSTIKGSRKITISKGSEEPGKNYNGKGKSDVFYQTDHPVEDYDALVHRMDADAARLMQEADVIAEDWASLDPWMDRIRGNPKNRREVEDIISKADYYQVHPDNYEFQPNPNNTPEFELERQAAHGELVHRFEKLPDKAKQVYQNVRDKFKQHHAAMQDALIQRIQRSNLDGLKKKEMADEIRRQFEQASKYGPYFPFSRFGTYTVQVFHEPDARGNTFSFEKFPTRRQARQFANKEKLKGRRVVEGVDLEKQHAMQDVSSGFVTDVMNLMGDDAAAKDQLYQLYLQYMPDLSGRKHFIHRNFVQGWNPAMLRSYSSTMFHSAKQIARIRFGDLLERQLGLMESAYNNTRNGSGETDDLIAAGHVVNEMRKRHELIMNPPGAWWAYMANNIGFVWHLAASPAAALVNLSQTPMVAHPVIAAAFPKVTIKGKEQDGYIAAAKLFTQATAQFAKGFRAKGTPGFFSLANSEDLSQEEKAALQEAIDEGHISLTQSHDLAGRADDAGKFGTHDIMTRVSTGLGYLFHHTERANREITFIVAYRMGKAAGLQHRDALNQALNLMYAGHGDYSSNNRPRWFRSNSARVITQFKAYSQFMSYLWGRGLRQAFYGESPEVKRAARRQLLGMGLMTGGMAGVLGLPMVTTALGIMSAIVAGLSDDDEPVDLENDLRVWMANNIPESIGGKKTAEMILKGLPRGVTPADLHSRVGQQSMWFRESDKELEGHDWFSYYLEQMLGPSAGLAGRITDGLRMFASAEDGTARERAMEMMMPKFIADPLKAGRYATEGIRSMKSGDMILEPTKTEQLLKLAGFAPARYGEMIEARTVVKNAEKAIQDRRQKLVNQYWVASRFGDEVERRKVVEAIKAFNLRNKTWPITGVNLRNSARSHIRAGLRMQDGYIVNPRLKHLREKGEFLAD